MLIDSKISSNELLPICLTPVHLTVIIHCSFTLLTWVKYFQEF